MTTHFIKLTDLAPSDKIATDDWKATQYDALHDLGFEIDDIYNMEFEHEEKVNGKDRYLTIKIHKKEDHWVMEIKTRKDKEFTKREYKDFKTLIDVIHKIFEKF